MANLPPTYVEGFHDAEAVAKMSYTQLGGTDMDVSKLSLGCAGFSPLFGEMSVNECKETVHKALKSGINYIDTAPWYGQGVSEETLRECLKGIPRKAYYIATKIGRYELDPKKMFDFSAEKTRESIDVSLKRLGLEYVDLIQMHDIDWVKSVDYCVKETLPVLQEAVRLGKARYIGVTCYPVSVLDEFVTKAAPAKIDTVLSYSRFTLLDSTLMDHINSGGFKGMGVINAAGLALGLLTNGGPQPWHPAHKDIKDVCSEAREICKSKNIELARLAMHYVYTESAGKSAPHTHLVGMNKLTLLDTNMDVLLNGLKPEEEKVLEYLKKSVFTKLVHHHWENCEEYFRYD